MSATNYLEKSVLNHILGGPAYTKPATVYVALYTAAPTDSQGTGTEVSGNNYARVALTNDNTSFAALATDDIVASAKVNATAIVFPQASGAGWGSVTHFGIFDAASAGNCLFNGALGTARTILAGDAPRFLAGQLSITAD
jgi:hypothetical protein